MKFKKSRKQMSPGMQKCKDHYGSKKGRTPSPFNKIQYNAKNKFTRQDNEYHSVLEDRAEEQANSNPGAISEGASPMGKVSAFKNMIAQEKTIGDVEKPIAGIQAKAQGLGTSEHKGVVKGAGKATENIVNDVGSGNDMLLATAAQGREMNKIAYDTASIEEWDAQQREAHAKHGADGDRSYQKANASDISSFEGGNWIKDLKG